MPGRTRLYTHLIVGTITIAAACLASSCGDRRATTTPGPGPGPGPGPTTLCLETCGFSGDGDCDDGGEGSDFSACDLGTDCSDCGPRTVTTGGTDAGSGLDSGGGGTDAGPEGCGDGCPDGQSCILDRCTDNGGGGSDNGEEGDACMCDEGSGERDVYKLCSGTGDGCMGFGGTGQLSCLAGETGAGNCRYTCSSSDEGSQGRCPDGWTCSNSGRSSLTGTNWFTCLQ